MNVTNRKKQRGQRRKLNALFKNTDMFVPFESVTEKYEHFHVPGDTFIGSPRTHGKVKTAFCKKWLEVTERIIVNKPVDLDFCKVVAVIDNKNLWNSQIIIFYSQDCYDNFWNRKSSEQKWEILDNKALSLVKVRNMVTTLMEKGYVETICDDDGFCEQSMLWFYGEL